MATLKPKQVAFFTEIRTNGRKAIKSVKLVLLGTLVLTSVVKSPECADAAAFTVNSVGDGPDVNPGDGFCADGNANCTLRAAIEEANAAMGTNSIAFNIPGTGPHSIRPATILPDIEYPVLIDGYSQSGSQYNNNPVGQGLNSVLTIELDGSLAPNGSVGLHLTGTSSTVQGLVVNRFDDGIGIWIDDQGGGNTIRGCFIGTDITGTLDAGGLRSSQGDGIRVSRGPGVPGGINSTGSVIGGTDPAERNLISGNNGAGIRIDEVGVPLNKVQGNLIGTDITGTVAIGNATEGVAVSGGSENNLIGGTDSGAGNVISGNSTGINIVRGAGLSVSAGNVIQGNIIGLVALTSVMDERLPNGVGIRVNAPRTTIGGATSEAANIISGNTGYGIIVSNNENSIQGNLIGTGSDGVTAVGNGAGILFDLNPSDNLVGGTAQGAGNTIAFNAGPGVRLSFSGGTSQGILGNSTYSNEGLGIDLGGDAAVQPNDPGDTDSGPNELQNYPVISFAELRRPFVIVRGQLDSTPNTDFRLEFFVNRTCDPSGNGEGAVFLGRANHMSPASSGPSGFSQEFDAIDVRSDDIITATATDANNNTSEFSACYRMGLKPVTGHPGEGRVVVGVAIVVVALVLILIWRRARSV